MIARSLKRLIQPIHIIDNSGSRMCESYSRFMYGLITQSQSRVSNADDNEVKKQHENEKDQNVSERLKLSHTRPGNDLRTNKHGLSDDDESGDSKWRSRLELAWLPKALEPALQLCRWALPTGNADQYILPPSSRSVSEIIASIQRSKVGVQDWSLSDLTIGLYLLYLRQASDNLPHDISGEQVSSDLIVHDLMYHIELAKGCYKDGAAGVARNSMLREGDVLKFIKSSSVLRPGYYIGVDHRRKLVILAIRGTHTVYDIITDIVSSSDDEVTFEGYSTHFGSAEAARWFLTHEIGTLKKYLDKYEGFRLRIVGHSLGGAIAALLAIMLRTKSKEELGFDPDTVTAVGCAAPPCVSKELAESCSEFVCNVVMQDDIVPQMSLASLTRLRNEILETNWTSVIEKGDWRRIVNLVTNAKLVVSSAQDVARKLAEFAKFRTTKETLDDIIPKAQTATLKNTSDDTPTTPKKPQLPVELFVPGSVYYLRREMTSTANSITGVVKSSGSESFRLWRRNPGDHFQRIVLSSNLISDHKCDSHCYALRDVLKSMPTSTEEALFAS
ncbi:hypothetical protein MLD38_039315 [Melastoma candidum]|uniref:Uncharacterized protein n=1 Tax=Melastoma candidum TaxID=119954 RepID=A0ACB9L205_9MYRT|nr:hypothetical protein MLD38_039315 [Melastoma candidum]